MSTTVDTTMSIRPFNIDVPQAELDDLHRRIADAREPHKELVADRSQGVQLATLQALADYWANDYDWPASTSLKYMRLGYACSVQLRGA